MASKNSRANVVVPKTVPPKTTLMNDRAPKRANLTGKQPMMYGSGSYGESGNGLKR